MWELEAIAKANTSEEARKRVSEEEMEEVRKKVRCVFEESVIRKEDVSGLIEEIERVCYCVCFVKLCMGVLRVDCSVWCHSFSVQELCSIAALMIASHLLASHSTTHIQIAWPLPFHRQHNGIPSQRRLTP